MMQNTDDSLIFILEGEAKFVRGFEENRINMG